MADFYSEYKQPKTFMKAVHTKEEAIPVLKAAISKFKSYSKDFKEGFFKEEPKLVYVAYTSVSASASTGSSSGVAYKSLDYDHDSDSYVQTSYWEQFAGSGSYNGICAPFKTKCKQSDIPKGTLGEKDANLEVDFFERQVAWLGSKLGGKARSNAIYEQSRNIDEHDRIGKNASLSAKWNNFMYRQDQKSKISATSSHSISNFLLVPMFKFTSTHKKQTYCAYVSATDLSVHNADELKRERIDKVLGILGKTFRITGFLALIALPFLASFLFLDSLVKASWLWLIAPLWLLGFGLFSLFTYVLSDDFNLPYALEIIVAFLVLVAPFALFITGARVAPAVQISNAEQIKYIRNYNFANFELTQDIDMSEIEVKAIGRFWGTLDGNGHAIKGVKFENINNSRGFIKNLHGTVKDVNFTSYNFEYVGLGKAGGLVGTMHSGSKLENVSISGKIKLITTESLKSTFGLKTNTYIGGLVGYQKGGTINNVTLKGEVFLEAKSSTERKIFLHMGGLVGYQKDKAKLEDYNISEMNISSETLEKINSDETFYEARGEGYLNYGKIIGNAA